MTSSDKSTDKPSNTWEVVIGLEVHAQVNSNSKLFSGAPTKFGAAPNTQVSLVDAAMPGMLPVLNEYCVKQAIKTGLSINARINKYSAFDRKNYFYADLPQGYQISQFYHPIVEDGHILLSNDKKIRIERIHLEQDAGKSIHDQSPNYTFIDLNRAGIALMEIVTKPDISSSEEAAEFIKKLRSILRYIETCDGDMEKGSLRCDANVSIRRFGAPLGTRCEIKNLNSIKNIVKAIDYEVERQIEILENGGTINQETRLFDTSTGETRTMRTKEDAFDYRYFPEPDLKPLKLTDEYIQEVARSLPELPESKIKRYTEKLGLSRYDAEVLTAEKEVAYYFEEVIKGEVNPKAAANWITGELFGQLNAKNQTLEESKVKPLHLQELLSLIEKDVISGKIAKTVLEIMVDTGESPKIIVDKHQLAQISDTSAIEKVVVQVIQNNPKVVEDYKSGKDKLFGFFVGQVMKLLEGKASPSVVNELVKKHLG